MTTDPYKRLDIWETVKNDVLDRHPHLTVRIEELRGEPWRGVSVAEARVLAVMVRLGLDTANAPERRRVRRLLPEIVPCEDRGGFGVVRETPPVELLERLDDSQREALGETLRWIGGNPPAEWLASEPGPVSAATRVRREAKALGVLGAYRWLTALGYPSAVPDTSRQRFLQRIGWIEQTESTVSGRVRVHRRIEELAHDLGVRASEFDLIIGAFTGALGAWSRDAARCLARPRCLSCPVCDACPHFQSNKRQIKKSTRHLAATTRREQRPRERLERHGPKPLSEEELLAIVLRTGSGGANALDVAHQMLLKAGSLERLASMSVVELARFPGVGRVKAITIRAALELARRLRDESDLAVRPKINSARKVYDLFRPRFLGEKQEHFYVLLLNTKLELEREVLVSTGTLNSSPIHPREVFNEAIRDSAHAVIFVHNHPSGDPKPSQHDIAITRKLLRVSEIVGIEIKDHVIVGDQRFYSFSESGQLV